MTASRLVLTCVPAIRVFPALIAEALAASAISVALVMSRVRGRGYEASVDRGNADRHVAGGVENAHHSVLGDAPAIIRRLLSDRWRVIYQGVSHVRFVVR